MISMIREEIEINLYKWSSLTCCVYPSFTRCWCRVSCRASSPYATLLSFLSFYTRSTWTCRSTHIAIKPNLTNLHLKPALKHIAISLGAKVFSVGYRHALKTTFIIYILATQLSKINDDTFKRMLPVFFSTWACWTLSSCWFLGETKQSYFLEICASG